MLGDYNEAGVDYVKRTESLFPSVLSEKDDFRVFIKLMAYALAMSSDQPYILKYIYHPDKCIGELLPRLADTLSFDYPLSYPVEKLRTIIKYIQRIRRTRGTFSSIKKLIRLLDVTEEEVLSMNMISYADVEVDEPFPGFLYIRYDNISDFDFAYSLMNLVVPAGYDFRLESTLKGPIKHRVDFVSFKEKAIIDQQRKLMEKWEFHETFYIKDVGGYQDVVVFSEGEYQDVVVEDGHTIGVSK